MKKPKIIIAGFFLLGMAAFQGCQNCDPMVQEARTSCEGRISAVKDSLTNVFRQQTDALNMEFTPTIQQRNDSLSRLQNPAK